MIKGQVVTNVDAFIHHTWPTMFVDVPRKGDRIRSRSGIEGTVLSITHCCRWDWGGSGRDENPYVEIYVTK